MSIWRCATAARPSRMNGLVESCLYTRAVKYNMRTLIVGELAGSLDNVFLRRIDGVVCTESLREFLSFFADF